MPGGRVCAAVAPFKTADYRTDYYAFIALTQLVHPTDCNPKYQMSGPIRQFATLPDGAV